MSTIFGAFIATLVTVPFLGLFLFYIITVKWNKNPSRSLKIAVDGSTILFIASVQVMIAEIWNVSIFWLTILFFLLLTALITFLYWKKYEDVYLLKVVRQVWRLHFLIFVAFYLIFMLYGMVTTVEAVVANQNYWS
ncbi:DUF3397 family protein [Texcoconibacillus texcoconensis]|uniref:ABC-type Na+ efflux pump permease subunit n=1 Tax=Texcoconibacillus texcoconensis TaxID=1095777 RepID=A0A840QLE2_9BACI|nr:ABC-type Na+ efflux pump permease subunit [Texcoconibacillus texcoconensis]